MLYSVLLFLFVLDCALLMVVILVQDSKGQGLGGAFGGGGGLSGAMFGGRGAADFLSKSTTYLGTAFLVLCIIMSLVRPPIEGGGQSIIMDSVDQQQQLIPETGLPLLPGATPNMPPPAGGIIPSPAAPDTSGGGATL